MKRRLTSIFRLVLVIIPLSSLSIAHAADDDDRPRIGVAFGGGGARGAAHVGVIRVLEEMQIPVDYVAGTSMGAIVGALYSLGMTADEIEAELLGTDWNDLFDDRVQRSSRSMRRKQDDAAAFFPIELGIKHGRLSTPRGFITGQKFAFAFSHPGLITSGHSGFDSLPIPYRAVATDFETGEKVVLDRGNLIRAVRASMSIPGVFPPVEYDGRLLVDGFLASNVPVDVVREMGADIVIAIDVGRRASAMSREDLQSLSGINQQMARLRSKLADLEEVGRADVLIWPDVDEWSGQEYDQLDIIIPRGYAAADTARARLAQLAVSESAWRRWRQRIEGHPQTVPVVDVVVLDNRSRIDDEVIRRRLDAPTDEVLDTARLRDSFADIYELGLLETIDFDLRREDSFNVLEVTTHEKPYAPWIVHLGGAYSMSSPLANRILLLARINRREVNRWGAEWRTDLSIGSLTGILTEFHQPLGWARHWSLTPALLMERRQEGVYENNQSEGTYRKTTYAAGLDLGVTPGHRLELSVGVTAAHIKATPTAGVLLPYDAVTDEIVGPRAHLAIDTLDEHRVPRRGIRLDARFERPSAWLGTDVEYDRLWGAFLGAFGGHSNTLQVNLQGGTDLGSSMPFYRQFYLGGLRKLSGYKGDVFRGNTFGLATLGWLHRLGGGDLPFASRSYLGIWAEAGNTWATTGDVTLDDLRYCGAITLLVDTMLGPLQVGYGRADDGNDVFHLDFGIHIATPSN